MARKWPTKACTTLLFHIPKGVTSGVSAHTYKVVEVAKCSECGNMEKQVCLRGMRVRSVLVEMKEAGWNRSWRWNQGTLKEALISWVKQNKCKIGNGPGTDKHRLYECIDWHKVRLQSQGEVRCCEQIARTSAKQWL